MFGLVPVRYGYKCPCPKGLARTWGYRYAYGLPEHGGIQLRIWVLAYGLWLLGKHEHHLGTNSSGDLYKYEHKIVWNLNHSKICLNLAN